MLTPEEIQTEILALRIHQRSKTARWLREIQSSARDVATKFSEAEWMILVVAYDCVPWSRLQAVDVNAASSLADEEDYAGAFSQTLAGFLLLLTGDYADV